MTAKKQISLLPQSSQPDSLIAKLVDWLTTVGRVVIIVTELIVVTAFFSRFWLDRQNSDLSEKIRQQQAILTSTVEFEKEFNIFQQRLILIKTLSQHRNITNALDSLLQSTPPTIYYQTLSIDPQSDQLSTRLSATAFSSQSVIDFITNLILNNNIQNVFVTGIEKAPKTSFFTINISINFKNDFASQHEI